MKKITIFVHGATKENPGPAAIAVRLIDPDGAVILEFSESIGNAVSAYAEYYAVMRGLQTLEERFGEETKKQEYTLKLSDETIAKQLNNESEIKEPGLVPLFIEIHNMRVTTFSNITFTYVSPKANNEAEHLVKEALSS